MKYNCLDESHSRRQSTLANSHIVYQQQLLDLEDRQKDIWQNINNLRQAFAIVKRQTKRGLENLRDECLENQEDKLAHLSSVLTTLDVKIQFIMDNCDKYIGKINQKIVEITTKNDKIYEEAIKCQAIYQSINHRTMQMESQVQELHKKYKHSVENLQQKSKQCEFYKAQLTKVSLDLGQQVQKLNIDLIDRNIKAQTYQKDIQRYLSDIAKLKLQIEQKKLQIDRQKMEQTIIDRCNIDSEVSRSIVKPLDLNILTNSYLLHVREQVIESIVVEGVGPSAFEDYRLSQLSQSSNDTLMFYPK